MGTCDFPWGGGGSDPLPPWGVVVTVSSTDHRPLIGPYYRKITLTCCITELRLSRDEPQPCLCACIEVVCITFEVVLEHKTNHKTNISLNHCVRGLFFINSSKRNCVWPENTTITHCRQTQCTVRTNSHTTSKCNSNSLSCQNRNATNFFTAQQTKTNTKRRNNNKQ